MKDPRRSRDGWLWVAAILLIAVCGYLVQDTKFAVGAESLATVAVALFAVGQLLRERRDGERQTAALQAELDTTLFALRRQLISWIGTNIAETKFPEWVRRNYTNAKHFDSAERRFETIIKLSALSRPGDSRDVGRAFALFHSACDMVNDSLPSIRDGWDEMEVGKNLKQAEIVMWTSFYALPRPQTAYFERGGIVEGELPAKARPKKSKLDSEIADAGAGE